MASTPTPTLATTPVPSTGFERALKAFESRLTPNERAQFNATSLDDLKVTILSIQADQRSRKQMMNMGRIKSFLEAMEQFGKVIEVFLNKWAGRWILENEEIKAWLSPPVPKASIIWMNGVPGAGKSVLASVVTAEIKEKGLAPVAFCYCKHQDSDKNTFISILKAFLGQLIIQQEHLIPFYYEEGISSGEIVLHSVKLSSKLLRYILQNIHKVFLILDGLDECDPTERRLIMEFLNDVINICDTTKPGKVRLLITSRDEPDIKRSLSLGIAVRITEQDTLEDIRNYITHRASLVEQKFKAFGLNKDDREYIEQYVLDKSDGMFLYAKLVMINLEAQPSVIHLREELYRLPTGLSEAYGRNMDRIQKNPRKNEREIAQKILSWMVCSKRPLRWRELQGAISIDPDNQVVDPVRRLAIHVKDICGSLVEVLPGDRVEFIHATARLYIVDLGYVPLSIAELSMSALCLNYLTFQCFEEQVNTEQILTFGRKGYFAFQDYAIAHWADHLLAWIKFLSDGTQNQSIIEKHISNIVLLFGDRFYTDLAAFEVDQDLILQGNHLQGLDCSHTITVLWRHIKALKALQYDRQDKVSLLSLGKALERSRNVLEDLPKLAAKGSAEAQLLLSLYGENWFKCSRLSCYYFHEGFQSRSSRQGHYDRHDRPFRCEEEDCPAGAIGFASLKELEKHKRNMHPGIDKLSSTFARLKKITAAQALLEKYPCPVCPSKFPTRIECRIHMRIHTRTITPATRI